MRRRRWTAWAAAVLALGAAAGCGVRPTGTLSAGTNPDASGRAATVTVYLIREGRVTPVVRPGLPGHPYLAIEQLSVPPTFKERRAGLSTDVGHPLVARVVDVQSMLIVDLPPHIPRARVAWSRTALAQIACTADAVPGIKRVKLWSAPRHDKHGWGVLACLDYRDLVIPGSATGS